MQRGDTSSSHREKAKAIIAKRSSKGFYPAMASSSNKTDSIDVHQSSMPRQYPFGLDQQYVTDRIVEPLHPQMQYNTSYVPSDHHYGSMSQIDLQCAYGYARTGEAPLGLIPETSTYQRNSIKNICGGQFHNEPHVSESVATPTIRNHTQSTAVTSIISAQNSEQFNLDTVKRLESNQSQRKHASSIQAETNQNISYAINDFDQPLKSNPAQNEYASSIHVGTDHQMKIAHARYDADQPLESNQAQNKHDSSIQAEINQETAHAMFDADEPLESNPAQNEYASSIQADQEIAHARYDDDHPLESNPAQKKHNSSIQAETNQEIAHAMFDADEPLESNPAQNEYASSIQADQEIAHARYDDDHPLESNPAQNIHSSQAVARDNTFQNTKKHSMYVNEENFPHPAIHKTNETASTTMLITDLIRPARKRAVADSDIESSKLAATQSPHVSSSRRSSKRSDSELKSRSNSVRMSRSTRYSSYSQSSASSYSSDSGSYSSRPGSYDDKSVSYYTSDGW
jgi:DNA-directed RNA polymerase subunit L